MIYELLNCEDGRTHYSITNPTFPSEEQGKALASAIMQYKPAGIRRTDEVAT